MMVIILIIIITITIAETTITVAVVSEASIDELTGCTTMTMRVYHRQPDSLLADVRFAPKNTIFAEFAAKNAIFCRICA